MSGFRGLKGGFGGVKGFKVEGGFRGLGVKWLRASVDVGGLGFRWLRVQGLGA